MLLEKGEGKLFLWRAELEASLRFEKSVVEKKKSNIQRVFILVLAFKFFSVHEERWGLLKKEEKLNPAIFNEAHTQIPKKLLV